MGSTSSISKNSAVTRIEGDQIIIPFQVLQSEFRIVQHNLSGELKLLTTDESEKEEKSWGRIDFANIMESRSDFTGKYQI
jgi:hypothetical protein